MLLQTIKSRNLWLWGESVMPSSVTSEAEELKAEIQDLKKKRSQLTQDLAFDNEFYKQSSTITQDDIDAQQKELSDVNAQVLKKSVELKKTSTSGNAGVVNEVSYSRIFTDPFKITALQNVSFIWDNPIGESYGIKTNFLQAWHNKPVQIQISGLSYIGAYGGKTVGNLRDTSGSSRYDARDLGINTAIQSNADIFNKLSSDYFNKTTNTYETIVDDDIYQINKLMSLYGEGMYTSAGSDVASPWIHLLLENDPGGQESKDQFVAFVGHIKNFNYKEDASKPFLYSFDLTFVGEPAITKYIAEAEINAEQDKNALKLTVVASDTGYSLGYGF
jgi:hypothetical protein